MGGGNDNDKNNDNSNNSASPSSSIQQHSGVVLDSLNISAATGSRDASKRKLGETQTEKCGMKQERKKKNHNIDGKHCPRRVRKNIVSLRQQHKSSIFNQKSQREVLT